jgi:hypothetical protein
MPVYPVPYGFFPIPPSPAFPQGRIAARPLLALSLIYGGARISCYAIVDSGADQCAFPLSFALALGINPFIGPSEPSCGLGSSGVQVYFWDVVIDLQGVTQFPARVGFTEGLNQWGIGLLGQDGFFNRFRLTFSLNRTANFEIEIP